MWTFIKKNMALVPSPYRQLAWVAILFTLGVIVFAVFDSMASCRYGRSSQQYEKEKAAWTAEKQRLLGSIAEQQREIDALQPQILAYEQLAEDKKKLDEGVTARIDQITEDFKREQQNTNAPTDCRTRADRVYDKYRAAGIEIDRDRLVREYCAGQ